MRLDPVHKTALIQRGDPCPGQPWHTHGREFSRYFQLSSENVVSPLDLHSLSSKEAQAVVILHEETRCLDQTMTARDINRRAK